MKMIKRCIECGKPIIPYKKRYTKCRKCFLKSVTNSYKEKKNPKLEKKYPNFLNRFIERVIPEWRYFLKNLFVFLFLFIIVSYIIFNCLQLNGFTNYLPDGSIKSFLSAIPTILPVRDTAKIELEVYELVNEERLKQGVQPLASDIVLSKWAQNWSNYLLENNLQLRKFGLGIYIFCSECHSNFSKKMGWGENVAIGGNFFTDKMIAQSLVQSWIDEPFHHKNMINKEISSTGVGVVCDFFDCYATQIFKPKQQAGDEVYFRKVLIQEQGAVYNFDEECQKDFDAHWLAPNNYRICSASSIQNDTVYPENINIDCVCR